MSHYIPLTQQDRKEMLADIGVNSVDELFSDIPPEIREKNAIGIAKGLTQYEAAARMEKYAAANLTSQISFMGCGSYDHIVPAAIAPLISRGEFLTAYTPYQAEISQGILQAIFEFQSMIAELTGLDVANASLYDGHTAASEAAVIALNTASKADTILYSSTMHPHTIEILKTFFADIPVVLEAIPEKNGSTDNESLLKLLSPRVAGVMVQTPNIYGIVEDYTGLAEKIDANGSLFLMSCNPMSLGILKTPGEWGAHIGFGDLQPFGLASCYGGPSVGYMAARKKFLRKLPGRISGQTLDKDGKRAFVLTLQAREQHIKRKKAMSNICSNQALAAIATTIYMSLVGREGLKSAARQNASRAHYLQKKLADELSVRLLHDKPFFNEFTVKLPCSAGTVFSDLAENHGILAGVDLGRLRKTDEKTLLCIAVTEKRTCREMDDFVSALRQSMDRASKV